MSADDAIRKEQGAKERTMTVFGICCIIAVTSIGIALIIGAWKHDWNDGRKKGK